jgi:hypothetical protein
VEKFKVVSQFVTLVSDFDEIESHPQILVNEAKTVILHSGLWINIYGVS